MSDTLELSRLRARAPAALAFTRAIRERPDPKKNIGFRPNLTGSSGGYVTVNEKLPDPEADAGTLAVTVTGALTVPAATAGIVAGVVATLKPVIVVLASVILGVGSFPVPVFSRQKN